MKCATWHAVEQLTGELEEESVLGGQTLYTPAASDRAKKRALQNPVQLWSELGLKTTSWEANGGLAIALGGSTQDHLGYCRVRNLRHTLDDNNFGD